MDLQPAALVIKYKWWLHSVTVLVQNSPTASMKKHFYLSLN
jgi:hypothetical protein